MDMCADLMHAHMHMRLMNEEDCFMDDDDEAEAEEGLEGKLQSRLKKSTRTGLRGSLVVSTPKGHSAEEMEAGFEPYLWFFAAAGLMAGWNAMMAYIGVFKVWYGGDVFLYMNIAYYVPALPILILNIKLSKAMDAKYGMYWGYLGRSIVFNSILILVMLIFPSMEMAQECEFCSGVLWVLAASFVLGAVGGMSYGTGFQFNSLASKKSRAFFMMGLFLPMFCFMAYQIPVDFSEGPDGCGPSEEQRFYFWMLAAALEVTGLLATIVLLHLPSTRKLFEAQREATRLKALEDDEKGNGEAALGNLPKGAPKGRSLDDHKRPVLAPEESLSLDDEKARSTWQKVRTCCVCIFVMIFAIVSISVFFGVVESDGTFGPALPVTLVYGKSAADFTGRVFTLFPLVINNDRSLAVVTMIRFVLVPLFFLYVLAPTFASDYYILGLVVVSGLTAGYINTACFMVAGKSVADSEKEASANFMNIGFQAGLLVSIVFSVVVFVFMTSGSSPDGPPSDDDKFWCSDYDYDTEKCNQWCGNRWGEFNAGGG